MKDYKDILNKVSLEDLKKGFVYDTSSETYTCLICGERFSRGRIYSLNTNLYEAWKAVCIHVETSHKSMFDFLLSLDKETTGFTEHQKKLLAYFHAGMSDKEIAAMMGSSVSTVRNQRFTFREKENQAKIVLTVFELLKEKNISGEATTGETLQDAVMPAKEPFSVSEDDEKEVLRKYFPEGPQGPLSHFPNREKARYLALRVLLKRFTANRVYTEKEVNAILKEVFPDYAILRRYLTDYGFLSRNDDGSRYSMQKDKAKRNYASDNYKLAKGAIKMDKEKKNKIKSEYKQASRPMGVYQIRSVANGKILVGGSPNLYGKANSYQAALSWDAQYNKELGEDWHKYGPTNFVFEILEELEPDKENPHRSYRDDLKALEELWLEKLQPYGDKGYNKPLKNK